MSDNVFEQQEQQERSKRVKRLLLGGGAGAAVAGGAVIATGALKGDDELSFPDETSDKAIDKAIADADKSDDVGSGDFISGSGAGVSGGAPVDATPGADRFIDLPGGAQVAAGEAHAQVIVDSGVSDPQQAGATATPTPPATPAPASAPPTTPTDVATPAPTPVTPADVVPGPGTTPQRTDPGPDRAEIGNVHIDPETGIVTEDGEVMGTVDLAGGPITLNDGTATEIVYDPQNGGTVQVGTGPATPLHDGTFGLLPGNELVEVEPAIGEDPVEPGDGIGPDAGPIDGRPDPGGDDTPAPPMGGDGELGEAPVPPMGGDGELGEAPVPPMGGDGDQGQSPMAPGLPGYAATTAVPAAGIEQPGMIGDDVGAPPPPPVDPGSTPGSVLGVGPDGPGAEAGVGAPPPPPADPGSTPGSVLGVGPDGPGASSDELSFPDEAPAPIEDADMTMPPPPGPDDMPPPPPVDDAPVDPPTAPHVTQDDDGPPPPPAGTSSSDEPPPPPPPPSYEPPAPPPEPPTPPPAPEPPAPEPVAHYDEPMQAAPPPPPPPPPAEPMEPPPAPPEPPPVDDGSGSGDLPY